MSTPDGSISSFSPTDANKVWLEAVLKRASSEDKPLKIIEYQSKGATQKGDNYASDLTRVGMTVVTASGKQKKVSVLIKELPDTEHRRAMIAEMNIFIREIMMYRDILPSMCELQSEFCDYSDLLWGRCLDYRPYDRLVLEDITKLGYKMNDRRLGLDYQHSQLVIRGLAKFHALSLQMKSRQLIPLEVFGTSYIQREPMKTQFSGMFSKMLENLVVTMEEKWEPEWKPSVDRLKPLIPVLMEKMCDVFVRDDTKFNVLNHGDCWLNNIMFKYGIASNTPITVKFVDYQLCFFNSPVFDLLYFLSTSINYDVRTKHRQSLLEEYHRTLLSFADLYQYKGTMITFDQLIEETKRCSLITLLYSMTLLPMMLIEKVEDVPDIEKLIKEARETEEFATDWLPNMEGDTYSKYMKLIVKDLVANNAI